MVSPVQKAPEKKRKRREEEKKAVLNTQREEPSEARPQKVLHLEAQGIFQRTLQELEYPMKGQSWKRSFLTGETQLEAPIWKS